MKNVKAIVFIIITYIFVSCDSWLGINITKKSDLEIFKDKAIDLLGSDSLINQITFICADRSLNIMGTALIYTSSEENKQKGISIDLSTWKRINEKNIHRRGDTPGSISIRNYDFSKIPDICQQAIYKIDSLDMEYAGIEKFMIKTSGNDQIYEFIMDGKLKNSQITSKGRYSGIYYYKMYFTINKDNDWVIEVDDKVNIKRGGF